MKLSKADKAYIEGFVDEIRALYKYDEEGVIPQYIEDMALNVLVILHDKEEQETNEF